MEETEKTAGISSREETNSAIGSWSGYIYQGLCGALVVLRMLKENAAAYKDYSLQLDAYEDFSIFDDKKKIYSLHQCKSVKNQTNYTDEFDKMMEKVEKMKANSELQDPSANRNYFHCNRHIDIDAKYAITAFQFEHDKDYCEPGTIQKLLNVEVAALKTAESDTDAVRARIEALINGEVLNTQQLYFDAAASAKLWQISRKQFIPFENFKKILDDTTVSLSPDDFLVQVKTRYINKLEENVEDETADYQQAKERVGLFVKRLNELSTTELRAFVQRVNPKAKVEDTLESLMRVASDERINYLYNLIIEFPLETVSLDWRTDHTNQTPTTLGNDERIDKICTKIYDNHANLDAVWIYDWMVGHVSEHVENIVNRANIITKAPDDDDTEKNNIFHTKKVGILTIDEKRNGIYD
ncbi:MAG: hypothetical protein IJ604_00080 [Prevotella sp.]|nr:hypothetical protein [Prevotella sp.]